MEEFINSSRRKSDTKRSFVQGNKHTAKTLDFIEIMTKEGQSIDDDEIQFCRDTIFSSKTNCNVRYDIMLSQLIKAEEK